MRPDYRKAHRALALSVDDERLRVIVGAVPLEARAAALERQAYAERRELFEAAQRIRKQRDALLAHPPYP